jgi:hypothetical protein
MSYVIVPAVFGPEGGMNGSPESAAMALMMEWR